MQVVLGRNLEVAHGAARFTYKMVMWLDKSIVTAVAFTKVEFQNLALLLENVEIAIDGSERDAGNLFTDLFIHPFCRRVRPCSF